MRFVTSILVAMALLLLAASDRTAADADLSLAEYKGKVVVLDFWASWCVPCRRSFPWLNEMHAKYGDEGLVIIGVNLDANRKDAGEFLAKYRADFSIHFDAEGILATRYDVQAMPSSYVIGRDGEVKARHLGFKVKRKNEYEAVLKEALGEHL